MKLFRRTSTPRLPFAVGLLCLAAASLLRAEPVADFSLVDRNTTSPRYDTAVSPRDYLHQVSGYYFGDPG